MRAVLPTAETDEFKPFVRKLPEFKFWHSVTRVRVSLVGVHSLRDRDIEQRQCRLQRM